MIIVILEVGLGRHFLRFFFLLHSRLFRHLHLTLLHLQLPQGDIQEVGSHLHIQKVISSQGERDSAGDDGQQVLDNDAVEGEGERCSVTAGNAGQQLRQKVALEGQYRPAEIFSQCLLYMFTGVGKVWTL